MVSWATYELEDVSDLSRQMLAEIVGPTPAVGHSATLAALTIQL